MGTRGFGAFHSLRSFQVGHPSRNPEAPFVASCGTPFKSSLVRIEKIWGREDLNLQALRHVPLKHARMPVPPRPL